MCRHVAHLGRPTSLADLLLAPEHGLLRQSWAPREQRHGTVNADGFGVGWYPQLEGGASRAEPARYRRNVPMWADPSFASFAGVVWSTCVLAAVRTATVGQPLDESACAPFLLPSGVLLSHNGAVPDVASALGRLVPSSALAAVGSTVDSAFVAAVVAARLAAGDPLPAALAAAVRLTADRAPEARLNLLATDGRTVAATTWGDTLVVRAAGGAAVVASEPSDDGDGWQRVPDRSLVTVTVDGVAVAPLTQDPPEDLP